VSAFPIADISGGCDIQAVFGSILLLMAAPVSTPLGVFERITAQEAAERFNQCGLGPVTIRWNDLDSGGEDILVATEVRSATDEQLRCADKAVSYYTLELPAEIERRFEVLRDGRLAPVFRARASSWLSARGLLNRVPPYRKGKSDDAAFTRQAESLCGPRAKGAFHSQFGFHAVSPDWVKRNLNPPDKGGEVLSCLMNVATVAGFEFGFVGNEYYQR
jgi:hypothetical protein